MTDAIGIAIKEQNDIRTLICTELPGFSKAWVWEAEKDRSSPEEFSYE